MVSRSSGKESMRMASLSPVLRNGLVVAGLLLLSSLLVVEGQSAVVSRFIQPEDGSFRSVSPGLNPLDALDRALSIVFYGLFPFTALVIGATAGSLTNRGITVGLIGLAPLWFAVATGGPGGGLARTLHLVGYAALASVGCRVGRKLKRHSRMV
jgi:hypothetical protein